MKEDNTEELQNLSYELRRLNNHRFIRMYNSTPRMIGFQFIRGLAFGLGSVVGATFLVSVVVYILTFIDFIPILGYWATRIVEQISL